MLDEIREARIKDTNFSLKGYPESKGESTLTAKQVKIDGIDYKKIRLIYKPDQEKKSFHPGSYFQYNQQFLSEKGKIEEQHGFAFMINNSEIFKIIVDDDTSKISKLKIYLFGRGGTYESINRLFAVNETLSPAQVKEAREQIASLTDVEKKKELYLMLQKKVPYHSQRDNGSPATDEDIANNSWMTTYNISTAGDIMCNLTSEAMCLEYLGITPPCKGCSSNCNSYDQFEDYMECTRVDKGFDHRGKANTREELAELFYNVGYESVILKTYEKDVIENKLRTSLEDGCSVLISAFGHNVRLQGITKDGLVVDDPYGKVVDFSQSGVTPKYKKDGKDYRNGEDFTGKEGDNNVWKWTDLSSNDVRIDYAEIYCSE
ncbi:MAG TPA: C39 family peptidase [Bacteroidales bacterium]|nr:C39 family peptidase [Bacteroidales bacterium]